jgi:hypothetical protein
MSVGKFGTCCCSGPESVVQAFKAWHWWPEWDSPAGDFGLDTTTDYTRVNVRYRTLTLADTFFNSHGDQVTSVASISLNRLNGQPTFSWNATAQEFDFSVPFYGDANLRVASPTTLSWHGGDWTLSLGDPYTAQEWEEDLDALLDAVDIAKMSPANPPWPCRLARVAYNDCWDGWSSGTVFPTPFVFKQLLTKHYPAPAIEIQESDEDYLDARSQVSKVVGGFYKSRAFFRQLPAHNCIHESFQPSVSPDHCFAESASNGNRLVEPPKIVIDPQPVAEIIATRELYPGSRLSSGGNCPCVAI